MSDEPAGPTRDSLDRRRFLGLLGAGSAAALAACTNGASARRGTGGGGTGNGGGGGTGNDGGGGNGSGQQRRPSSTIPAPSAKTRVVRLYSVVTPIEGGLYSDLLPDFERRTGYHVKLTGHSPDVYRPARAGKADLVISHYGHKNAEEFVLDGFGSWPETVFFNPMALLGPPSDPAQVGGLTDAAEAFRRIATTKAPFVVNNIEGVKYLGEILWNAVGNPDRTGWYQDQGLREHDAVTSAAQQTGYTLWGLTPFLTAQQHGAVALEPMVLEDPPPPAHHGVGPGEAQPRLGHQHPRRHGTPAIPPRTAHPSPHPRLPLPRHRPTDLVARRTRQRRCLPAGITEDATTPQHRTKRNADRNRLSRTERRWARTLQHIPNRRSVS